MREYLFRGKRVDNGEWVQGDLSQHKTGKKFIKCGSAIQSYEVIPESVCQYTGMNEFVMSDRSFHQPLFEGDIVEVWSTRRPYYTNPKSQYDGDVKVRAVICFKHGEWHLDYDNNYNKTLTKLRGREEDDRVVDGDWRLYYFGCHGDEEWQREHNSRSKWHDIVKLGNVFDNADLLEG